MQKVAAAEAEEDADAAEDEEMVDKIKGDSSTAAVQWSEMLGTCQIDEDNLHEQSLAECMGSGEAISNITLELKP